MIHEFYVTNELVALFAGKQVGLDYLTTVRIRRRDNGLQSADIT
jgi:hypothetical protein